MHASRQAPVPPMVLGILLVGLASAGCLSGPDDRREEPVPDLLIGPGAWRGISLIVEEPSYVRYSITPADNARLDICLVDITDGPVPTTGRPADAIGCHTSVAIEGASTVVPAGRYSLAIGCLNLETACGVDVGIEVVDLDDGPGAPGPDPA